MAIKSYLADFIDKKRTEWQNLVQDPNCEPDQFLEQAVAALLGELWKDTEISDEIEKIDNSLLNHPASAD